MSGEFRGIFWARMSIILRKGDMGRKLEIEGEKYNSLKALRPANKRDRKGGHIWVFECLICGNITEKTATSVVRGHTKSCGCLSGEKHGGGGKGSSRSRIYRIYHLMKGRCLNPTNQRYSYYGGRGITICDEWLGRKGFISFREWSLAHGYTEDLEIERKDNDGPYSPDNCKWATRKEQVRNYSQNRWVTVKGERMLMTDAINNHSPVSIQAVYSRIYRGWDEETAILTPKCKSGPKKRKNDEKG